MIRLWSLPAKQAMGGYHPYKRSRSDQGDGFPSLDIPNGAKTQLLMHTNPNYLLDLCILLGVFDRAYQLMA